MEDTASLPDVSMADADALGNAARHEKCADALALLQKFGAAVANTKSANGCTALIYAAFFNEGAAMTELLLKHGADPDILDSQGRTALMCAANRNALGIVTLLLDAGANVGYQTADGTTAAVFARKKDYHDVATLIEATPELRRIRAEEAAEAVVVRARAERLIPEAKRHAPPKFTLRRRVP